MNVSRETRPFCRKSRTKQALPYRLKQVKGVSRETPFVPNKRMCRKQEAAWISRSAAVLRNGAVSSAASPTIASPSPPAISAPQSLFGGQKPPPWLLAVNFETSTSFCCLRLLMQGALRKPLPSADLTACRRSSKSCGFMDFAEAFGKRRVPLLACSGRLASARRSSALPVAFAEDVSRETYQGWRAIRLW